MVFVKKRNLLVTWVGVFLVVIFLFQKNSKTIVDLDTISKNKFVILVKDRNGNIILNKDVSQHWNKPLKIWNYTKSFLTHLHITKTGGTSMDGALGNAKLKNGCKLKCTGKHKALAKAAKNSTKCPGTLMGFCRAHFDWSFLEDAAEDGFKLAPITTLREPVSRVVSEFYWSQGVEKMTGHKYLKQNINQFLDDMDSMMESNHVWHDGYGTAVWLAGIHIGTWWLTGPLSPEEIHRREQLATNWTYMLDTGIDHLHECLWVGILEKMNQSLEMLQYQTGLNISFGHNNKARTKPVKPTEKHIQFLKSLLPVDRFLYDYARQLHDHRWNMYINKTEQGNLEVFEEAPNLPPVIDGCISTRFNLKCSTLNISHNYTPSKEWLERTLQARPLSKP